MLKDRKTALSEHAQNVIRRRLAEFKERGDPLSQKQMADRLGVDPARITNWLKGQPIAYDKYTELASILRLNAADLRSIAGDSIPEWASVLEDLFDSRFKILAVNEQMPVIEALSSRFSLTAKARAYESSALRETGSIDESIGIVPTETIRAGQLKRTGGRLILPYQVGRWSQLTAMRKAKEPCYALYAGAILVSDDFRLLINCRSTRVRTYPEAYASFGGTFIPDDKIGFTHDVDLLEAVERELREETKIRHGTVVKPDEEIVIMLEQDSTEKGRQDSLQIIALNSMCPRNQLDLALKLIPAEGTVHAIPFHPANLDLWAHTLLTKRWAPCGLAHYLIWLARGGPGLPEYYKQYAFRLFDDVVEQMRSRGSWQASA